MSAEVEPEHPNRFQPGASGNPGGRPRGLARVTRELVGGEGQSIVEFWRTIMLDGEIVREKDGKREVEKATLKERLEASRLLAERGWGKPAQFQLIEDPDPLESSVVEQDAAVQRFSAEVVRLAERRAAADAASGNGAAGPTQS